MPSERVRREIDRFLEEAEQAMAASNWGFARDRGVPGHEDAAVVGALRLCEKGY